MTKSEILDTFACLDAGLESHGATLTVDVAGGAAMALLFDGRESTQDVDAVVIEGLVREQWEPLVVAVGAQLGLPPDGLNAFASLRWGARWERSPFVAIASSSAPSHLSSCWR